jgi:TIR domain
MVSVSSEIFDYDVALSFAGEDRAYVQQIATELQLRGVRIFYDEFAAAQLWGNDLYVLLDEVHRKRARFTVVFVSRYYASKPWTRHEHQSAQARALTEVGPYLLPVRLDDSELPGLRPTVGYVDARNTSVERLVWLIEQKLSAAPGVASSQQPLLRSPRTAEQKRELLAQRPECWEYLLYAGVLWQCREALEPKWRDHELGYGRRTGGYLDDRQAPSFISHAANDLAACSHNVVRMLDMDAQQRAFGTADHPADSALIEHIATRFVEGYEEMLDVAARLRGAGVSNDLRPLMEAAAHLTDTPLREIRDFIDQFVADTDKVPELLSAPGDETITVRLSLVLTSDDTAQKRFEGELKRVRRRLRA